MKISLLLAALALGGAAQGFNATQTQDDLIEETAAYGFSFAQQVDLDDVSKSMLNVFMPAHSATYFWALVPAGERRRFKGIFPKKADPLFFLSSIGAYDFETGLPITDQSPLDSDVYFNYFMAQEVIEMIETEGVVIEGIVEGVEKATLVMLRFYIDRRVVDFDELHADWIFEVFEEGPDGPANRTFPTAPPDRMRELADRWERVFEPWVEGMIPRVPELDKGTEFFKPRSIQALYPEPTNRYIVAMPTAPTQGMRITGTWTTAAMEELDLWYLDLMAVSGHTSRTDDAISHYVLWGDGDGNDQGGPWEVFVVPHGVEIDTASPVLHWAPETSGANSSQVIFRMIDSSCYEGECKGMSALSDGYAPPKEVAAAIGSLYPSVEYLEF